LHQLAGHLRPDGSTEAAAHLLQRYLTRPIAGQTQSAGGVAEPRADFRLELLGRYRDGQPALEAGRGLNGNVHDLIEDILELCLDLLPETACWMGWTMGLEPTTAGITTRSSTN